MINSSEISLEQLSKILEQYNIDTKNWSHVQGNKTPEELCHEIKNGESQLKLIDNKLTRLVRVSSIDVKFQLGEKYFQLIEDKQILFSGAIKTRNLSTLTEKLKANEDFLTGAYRCLKEEIGLEIHTKLEFIEETNFQQLSPNYPTLDSNYHIFNYQLILGEKELSLIRFSEYVSQEKRISLFTLIPLD